VASDRRSNARYQCATVLSYGRGFQTVGRTPWKGALLVLCGGRVNCKRDIFILNVICAQGKIYILTGTLLG
jgi:hypothetical protein